MPESQRDSIDDAEAFRRFRIHLVVLQVDLFEEMHIPADPAYRRPAVRQRPAVCQQQDLPGIVDRRHPGLHHHGVERPNLCGHM